MHLREGVEVEVVGFLRRGQQRVALPAGAGESLDKQPALLVEIAPVIGDRLGLKGQPRLGNRRIVRRPHRRVQTARRLIEQKPAVQADAVRRGEPCVVPAERFDELFLGPEGQSPHRRMRAVGADDQIGPQPRSVVRA